MGCVQSKPAVTNVEISAQTPSEADLPSNASVTKTIQLKGSPATSSYLSTPVNSISPFTIQQPEREAKDSQTSPETILAASQAETPSPAHLFRDVAQPTGSALAAQPTGGSLDIASSGASNVIQAVVAVVASAEILVAVGNVLQLMCALPFPGKFALVSCVCTCTEAIECPIYYLVRGYSSNSHLAMTAVALPLLSYSGRIGQSAMYTAADSKLLLHLLMRPCHSQAGICCPGGIAVAVINQLYRAARLANYNKRSCSALAERVVDIFNVAGASHMLLVQEGHWERFVKQLCNKLQEMQLFIESFSSHGTHNGYHAQLLTEQRLHYHKNPPDVYSHQSIVMNSPVLPKMHKYDVYSH